LREWAKALGKTEAHELLSEMLTTIAIAEVNRPGK
jgi:ferritin-like metal-binding protein YciE